MLALQVGVVVVAGLYLGREVLIPITLAVLLSFVLAPLANLLRRFRLGRVASVLVAVALAIGIVIVIGTVIGSQVASLATRLPEYTGTIETKIQSVRAVTIDRVSGLLDQLGSKSNAPSAGANPMGVRANADHPAGRQKTPEMPARKVQFRLSHWRNDIYLQSCLRLPPWVSSSLSRFSSCCRGKTSEIG